MFSVIPTIKLTTASPVRFSMVRTISIILSTGKIIAIHAGLRPTLYRTTINIISPALGTDAAPILANVAVKMIVAC